MPRSVYRTIARHIIHQADLTRATGATGAVTLVQRFGSALNLNVHFHMLFLDGVFMADGADPAAIRAEVDLIAREILANPVIEDYRLDIEE